ncbi:hypothetical protein [Streptomyces sp. enrichment culture]|uniref:hypothetical protein n=1 Tax=Streptomyces sp. enrichment culture TaxID=1795815 RepID=UPI003F57BFD5
MPTPPAPSVGRMVHYVSHGTPPREDGSQAFPQACRAAIVTEVDPADLTRVGLHVLNPTGDFLHPLVAGGSTYDEGGETPGAADCPNADQHGQPFRYCGCGWAEAALRGGTWHWPERV